MALMTKSERDKVISMATREDVRFALLDKHSSNLYKIAMVFRSDEYSVIEMASQVKASWERIALIMNDNRNLSHQDYAELMAVIIHLMDGEFRALGYSRKEFLDICSELQ